MRRLLCAACSLILLLGSVRSACAALSVIGASTDTIHQTGGGTSSFSSRTHTAGNMLVVLIGTQTAGTPAVSNTAVDTWNQCGGTVANGTNHLYIFSASHAGTAADVVQIVVPSQVTYDSYRLYEVHSSLASFTGNPCDTSASGTGTSSSLATSTLTITGAADIITAVMEHNSGGNGLVAGTGYTLLDDQSSGFEAMEYHIVSASEAATATTTAGSGTWAILGAAFKEPGSGATHCTGMMLGVWRCGV